MDRPKNDGTPKPLDGEDGHTLSIVVRVDPRDSSAIRVWLEHAQDVDLTTLATSPEHPFELAVAADRPDGNDRLVVRTKPLSPETFKKFSQAMEGVSEAMHSGLVVWTPLRTSAAFCASIWEATFDEGLAHRAFGLSTPETLARSIERANARDLGLTQNEEARVDIEISQRDHQFNQRNEDDLSQKNTEEQDQARRRGQSL